VTYLGDDFPVFWTEARGAAVRDADGNVFLDLTGAFGVALAGHAHPRIVEAVAAQSRRLVHGMGDVHPPAAKVELLERLARVVPVPEARGVLASTGSEAVEIALKTALLATDRPGILAFRGGYHGLTLGALAPTDRPYFREPFTGRIYPGVARTEFPGEEAGEVGTAVALDRVDEILGRGAPGGDAIGAVLVEPVQGRGGVRVPPPDFLARLGEVARSRGALLVVDEVFTGMGRCGAVLASRAMGAEPDVVCLGKALGGGLPLSACVAPARVMDAWPPSPGEALHTSTFLGHPLACAAAGAVLELAEEGLPERAREVGEGLMRGLREGLEGAGVEARVRGMGAMVGVELRRPGTSGAWDPWEGSGVRVAERALRAGLLVLPAGDGGEVVELTPPVVLTDEQEAFAVETLVEVVASVVESAG
jgi:4-aminobutyrate aminotransferase-like enzyme